ncbi:hypothetical protein pEaSNUABM29_00140 [Erwinia phage pEa_SNUABM_29]|nr:hypothetical protein pEaSNUABM29_00140 [Erwinia phage pEa_SNUABM_29]
MFSQAELNQVAIKGHNTDPSAITLAAHVKNNSQRIRNYFEQLNRSAGNGHLLQQVLSAIGYAADPDYDDIEWACRRKLVQIGNALRLTSVGEYGQIFNSVFIQGQDEVISLVARPVNPDLSFRDYTPARYLYHEYTNLNWKLGDGRPRGVSVIEINLVALLWQYVKGQQHYSRGTEPIATPVYLQRHVISRMLPSYMDIAFLNIHRAIAFGRKIEPDETLKVIPVPPLHDLAVRHAQNINSKLCAANPLPGQVLNNVPLFFQFPGEDDHTAVELILFRETGQTLQNTWHQNLVNWYWALYCFQYDQGHMDKYKKTLLVDLARYEDSKVLNRLTKSFYNYVKRDLITPMYAALEN